MLEQESVEQEVKTSELFKKVSNRFVLVKAIAERARQIKEGAPLLIDQVADTEEPAVVTAMREIAADEVNIQRVEEEIIEEAEDEVAAAEAAPEAATKEESTEEASADAEEAPATEEKSEESEESVPVAEDTA